ncbi:MAG TPA: class I SAM-dependent methyltransferase [Xanthobacteraceae bacterium]|nr:class I SAM-dependent methyltransferase [Xanthobacteraceae bacterium]
MSEAATLVSEPELARWYEGKTFSCDWTTSRIPLWIEVLERFRDQPARVVEIGSWEGRSALFFLNYLPKAQMVCIDTFGGNVEHHQDDYFARLVPDIEARFDANVAAFGSRVEKFKGPSSIVLPQLGIAGRRFDIAYVDGSHFATHVYSDAVLTWSLMAPGGIVIFDDYEWDIMEEEHERPKLGVDAFLPTIEGQYRVIHCTYQMLIEKL